MQVRGEDSVIGNAFHSEASGEAANGEADCDWSKAAASSVIGETNEGEAGDVVAQLGGSVSVEEAAEKVCQPIQVPTVWARRRLGGRRGPSEWTDRGHPTRRCCGTGDAEARDALMLW